MCLAYIYSSFYIYCLIIFIGYLLIFALQKMPSSRRKEALAILNKYTDRASDRSMEEKFRWAASK